MTQGFRWSWRNIRFATRWTEAAGARPSPAHSRPCRRRGGQPSLQPVATLTKCETNVAFPSAKFMRLTLLPSGARPLPFVRTRVHASVEKIARAESRSLSVSRSKGSPGPHRRGVRCRYGTSSSAKSIDRSPSSIAAPRNHITLADATFARCARRPLDAARPAPDPRPARSLRTRNRARPCSRPGSGTRRRRVRCRTMCRRE